jgi:uncharacterized protein YfaS (alpha-2-macroglobulin family)
VEVLQERPSAAADGAAAEDAAAGEQQQLEWRPLQLPRGVKALVLVNLQSYGGGRDIWGATPSKHRSWRTPSVSDGLIEARAQNGAVCSAMRRAAVQGGEEAVQSDDAPIARACAHTRTRSHELPSLCCCAGGWV